MGGKGRARRGAAISAALLLAFSGSVGAEPFVQVSREGSRFSIDATGVSVSTVLLALGREAGFSVQDSRPDIERPPIDIALNGATLNQTLNRLLDRQNHLIVYRNDAPTEQTEPGSIARIVLLAPRPDVPKEPVAGAPGSSPLAGPGQPVPVARPPSGQQVPLPAIAAGVATAAGVAQPAAGVAQPAGEVAQPIPGSGPIPPGGESDARQRMLEAAAAAAGSFAQQQGMSDEELSALAEAAAQQDDPESAIPLD
jgi:hypothetical protein